MTTTAEEMLRLYPDFIQTSRVFQELFGAEGPEIDTVAAARVALLAHFFVATATGQGLILWETFCGLETDLAKPVDQRRAVVISKLRGQGTTTAALVESVAEAYDNGDVSVTEVNSLYKVIITFISTRGIPPNLADLQAALNEIIPAHLALEYVFAWLLWSECDAAALTWDELDALAIDWDTFETGSWLP